MSDEIVIISPELTPGAGGVADYALRLMEYWSRRDRLKVLVPKKGWKPTDSLPYRVEELGCNTAAISEQLPPKRGKILVHYSAYGFDRIGYPRHLIKALLNWKAKRRGLLVILFHEIWTVWPALNKNAVVQFFHRRAIKQLVIQADAVFTTTQSQADYLNEFGAAGSVQVLPVGSNIGRNDSADFPRQSG